MDILTIFGGGFRQEVVFCCKLVWDGCPRYFVDVTWGFRVLDELDLCEFWKECDLTQGWFFEVLEGGWKALENTRGHFVSDKMYKHREFLIIGLNECVSVLGQELPKVTELISNKKDRQL